MYLNFIETPGVDIFFTVNGTKPDWNLKSRHNATYLYKSPFRLPGGKQTVKAMAVDRERTRESNVVTKQFEVDILQDDEPVDAIGTDSYGFIDDMDTSLPTGLSVSSVLQLNAGSFKDVANIKQEMSLIKHFDTC